MAWTRYDSTDPSAPVLSGTSGSLIALLDAVLINGYGTQPAAGWTKPFTGTNKAVYYNGTATAKKYVRILDDGSLTAAAQDAGIRGFDSMSDVDNGTIPMPSAAQQPSNGGSNVIHKSSTASATARPWTIFGDGRTVILCISTNHIVGLYFVTYFGEYYSLKVGDTHAFCIMAYNGVSAGVGPSGATGTYWFDGRNMSPGTFVPVAAVSRLVAGNLSGGASSIAGFGTTSGFGQPANPGTTACARLSYPNPTDNSIWLSPIGIGTSESGLCIRGFMRGLYSPDHWLSAMSHGDTFSGSGDLAGKSFSLIRPTLAFFNGGSYFNELVGETSTPAYTP